MFNFFFCHLHPGKQQEESFLWELLGWGSGGYKWQFVCVLSLSLSHTHTHTLSDAFEYTSCLVCYYVVLLFFLKDKGIQLWQHRFFFQYCQKYMQRIWSHVFEGLIFFCTNMLLALLYFCIRHMRLPSLWWPRGLGDLSGMLSSQSHQFCCLNQ